MSDSDTTEERVQQLLDEGLDLEARVARETGTPLLVGDADIRIVLTLKEQDPPLTPQEACRLAVLAIMSTGFDPITFVVQDQETEYLVNRDAILND